MEGGDGGDEGQAFRVNFSTEGVAKLRDRVKEKLKEYMGDYTDDTLVEYVIVLLKNGRRKDEARNELNVFLDDDSDSFVSWLWDHLGSNINHYVQALESLADEVAKTEAVTGEQVQLASEPEKVKPKSSISRHNRLWKGLVRDALEQPPLQSSIADTTCVEKESRRKVSHEKRATSPQPTIQRKRSRPEERLQNKREVVSQATANASRRLLQFAVRDAVATSRPSNLTSEPSLKRLRSVVSTSVEDTNLEEHPQKIQSVARVPNAMATAIKAVAEAAKDVKKVRSSNNVFDRLGRASDVSDTLNQLGDFGEDIADDGEDETFGNIREHDMPTYDQRNNYSRPYVGNMSILQTNTRMSIHPASEDDEYDVNVPRQGVVHISQTGTSGAYSGEDLPMVQGSAANSADELKHKSRKNQDNSGAVSHTSHKIVNASLTFNTWKSPQYQEMRESSGLDVQKSVQLSEAVTTGKSGMQPMKENNNRVAAVNGNAKLEDGLQKESQKTQSSTLGLYPIGQSAEDADSRSLFVNNVHFAATKDSLLRHFNKFGEVLKVIILTDAATGQPKGSAYVEFMTKEAADNALSLDGTSFMSRILKVVRKSSGQPEASSMTTFPRIARGSPFAVSRFGRVPFPRGIPGKYRTRLPVKPGTRSFQWKRDAQSTSTEMPGTGPASNNSISFTIPRSLTYVRAEPKTNESSGAT